jgi:hypothetical protein
LVTVGLRRRQFFSAACASLKIMASAVLLERRPFERMALRLEHVGQSLAEIPVVVDDQ